MVLLISIVILVALTLAALALTRSVYTSSVIAGNLAFQRSATQSSEAGIEAAVAWLEGTTGKAACAAQPQTMWCDQKAAGYLAKRAAPDKEVDWPAYWQDTLYASAKKFDKLDGAGNLVLYVIERMCQSDGDPDAVETGCTVSPNPGTGTCAGGSSCGAGAQNLKSPLPVYYRITVGVEGPRNTRSLVQAMVAM
jgi:type IV pilus assembly protein PilX